MKNFQFVSKSETDTKIFAKKLASHLQEKDVIVLSGDLGSRQNQVHRRYFKLFWFRK